MAESERDSGSSGSALLGWKEVSGGKNMEEMNKESTTTASCKAALDYVNRVTSDGHQDELKAIRGGLAETKATLVDYFSRISGWRAQVENAELSSEAFAENLGTVVQDFQAPAEYLSGICGALAGKRDVASARMEVLRGELENALSRLKAAESSHRDLYEWEQELKPEAEGDGECPSSYGVVHRRMLEEREELGKAMHEVGLADNLLQVLEVYTGHLDTLLSEAEELRLIVVKCQEKCQDYCQGPEDAP